MKNLDLIITVDTSFAHLAGALGLQVWLLFGQTADWRWGETDATSYWYANVRIFRQTSAGDWVTVVKTVSAELAGWADTRPTLAAASIALARQLNENVKAIACPESSRLTGARLWPWWGKRRCNYHRRILRCFRVVQSQAELRRFV